MEGFSHPLTMENYVPRRVYEVVRSGMNFWLPVHVEILSRYIPHSSILINDFNISRFILILHHKASDNSIIDLYASMKVIFSLKHQCDQTKS